MVMDRSSQQQHQQQHYSQPTNQATIYQQQQPTATYPQQPTANNTMAPQQQPPPTAAAPAAAAPAEVETTADVPSPKSVGREFVRQYYTLLNQAPLHLHRFYSHQSVFFHSGMSSTEPVS